MISLMPLLMKKVGVNIFNNVHITFPDKNWKYDIKIRYQELLIKYNVKLSSVVNHYCYNLALLLIKCIII